LGLGGGKKSKKRKREEEEWTRFSFKSGQWRRKKKKGSWDAERVAAVFSAEKPCGEPVLDRRGPHSRERVSHNGHSVWLVLVVSSWLGGGRREFEELQILIQVLRCESGDSIKRLKRGERVTKNRYKAV